MGAYKNIYVGCYLVVEPGSKEQNVTEFFHPTESYKMKTKFCPDSGAEGVKVTRTESVIVYPSPHEIGVEEFREDEFFSPAYTGVKENNSTWILNSRDSEFYFESDDDVCNIDLEDISPVDITRRFKEHYKNFIKEAEEKFGKVTAHFGVVYYAH